MKRERSISRGLTIGVVLLLVFTQTGLAGRLVDVASWGALGWGDGADAGPVHDFLLDNRHIGDHFTSREFELFGVASNRMMTALAEMAARYHVLGQREKALAIYDQAYTTQYMQTMALVPGAARAQETPTHTPNQIRQAAWDPYQPRHARIAAGMQYGIPAELPEIVTSGEAGPTGRTIATPSSLSSPMQDATVSGGADCPVSRVEDAFNGIPERGGQPLAFSYWHGGTSFTGDNPTHCQHYQGIARKDYNGTPYFFFTRSGNRTGGCPLKNNDPGELLIVNMGSKPGRNGEELGRSCAQWPPPYDMQDGCGRIQQKRYLCAPAGGDVTVKSIHFDGNGWPGWMHPGGVQLVDDVLVVPMEEPYPNGGNNGALVLIDVSNPVRPQRLKEIDFEKKIGVVGVVQEPSGKYLFVLTGGAFDDGNILEFYESDTTSLRAPSLELNYVDQWTCYELPGGCDKWRDWQTINFVRDVDGTLFLIGTDNVTDNPCGGIDWARLFQVTRSGNQFTLGYEAERHLYSATVGPYHPLDMGDLDAVGGVYVSPSGRLILYMGLHDNDWRSQVMGYEVCPDDDDERCHAYQFGEFASDYYYDGIPPVTDRAVHGTVGDNGWYTSKVGITLSASDTCGSGVELIQYKIDSGSWQDYSEPFVESGDGTHIVYYRSQDNAGNWESEKQFSLGIDATSPTTSPSLDGTVGENGWYRSSVAVTLNAGDGPAGSGVELTQYRLDNGYWQDYSEPFVESGDGTHIVYYKSQDNAGNWESEKQVGLRIDTTAPTGSVSLNNGAQTTFSALVRASLSAIDTNSGLYQRRLRDADGSWGHWKPYAPGLLWQLPNPETSRSYAVKVQFKDRAGNMSRTYHDAITLNIYPARPGSAGYWLGKSTFGACGSAGGSSNYRMDGTVGQPSMIGRPSSANYSLSSGYWAVRFKVELVYLPLILK